MKMKRNYEPIFTFPGIISTGRSMANISINPLNNGKPKLYELT